MAVELAAKQGTSWMDEFAEKNRPSCPSCGRGMKRTGQRLWKGGEFRTFKYSCTRCDKYAIINTQEVGYHEPSEVDWKVKFAEENRPWCCGKQMRRMSSRLWEGTGVRSFRYVCSVCKGWKIVKTYEPNDLPANPTLEALDPTRIDKLIRSKAGNNEDCIQDAWLAVLEQGVTTEDAVLKIAEETFKSSRSQSIRDEHTNVSLSAFGILREGEPEAQDKLKILSTGPTEITDEEALTEPARCPHCRSRDTLVPAGPWSDKKGIRKRYLCRTCWRFTLWPRKYPYKQQGKIHIAEVSKGDEVDLSSVSRGEVARRVHCSQAHISAILCGHTTASLPLFYDIAKAVGCTMDELFRVTSGANGKNPARLKYKRKSSWRVNTKLPPKYIVDGKGYPNLREALLSVGVEYRQATHYNLLSPELQAQITRNRLGRGR